MGLLHVFPLLLILNLLPGNTPELQKEVFAQVSANVEFH